MCIFKTLENVKNIKIVKFHIELKFNYNYVFILKKVKNK